MVVVWWVGAVFLALQAFYLGRWVHFHYFQKPQDWTKYKGKFALVTGASDGIGKGVSRSLAKRGINVILVSRTQAKLDALAAELSAEFGVTAVPIAFDCHRAIDDFDGLVDLVSGYQVDILVNNVGGSGYAPGQRRSDQLKAEPNFRLAFRGTRIASEKGRVDMNINATVALTHAFLPAMAERGMGRIMNVSSLASQGMPSLATYGGANAFVNIFSKGLRGELAGTGVEVQAIVPGQVATYLTYPEKPGGAIAAPDDFAEMALNKSFRGGSVCVPFPAHAAMWSLGYYIPEAIALRLGMSLIRKQWDRIDGGKAD